MGTGVGEMALLQAAGIGAATGAGTAALTGGDPLKGALIGGITGGAGHGFAGMGAAGGGAGAAGGGAGAAGATGTAAATDAATNLATQTAADAGTNLAATGIDPGLMATGQVGVTPSPMELAEFQRSAASFQLPTDGPNARNRVQEKFRLHSIAIKCSPYLNNVQHMVL
jgi:hypothetical protein